MKTANTPSKIALFLVLITSVTGFILMLIDFPWLLLSFILFSGFLFMAFSDWSWLGCYNDYAKSALGQRAFRLKRMGCACWPH